MTVDRRASLLLAIAGLLLLASATLFIPQYRRHGSGGLAAPYSEQPQVSLSRSLGYASSAPSSGLLAAEQTLEKMNIVRKRIRTGELTIEVKSYEGAAEKVVRIAESHGGYLVTSEA